MGCFSYLCHECGEGICSDSFTGERCRIYLLLDGEAIEEMRGEYDSYGRVFIDGTQRSDVKHPLRESYEFKMENHEGFSSKDIDLDRTGYAMVHERCFTGELPTRKSDYDPNQGWGAYTTDDGEHVKSFWTKFKEHHENKEG